MVDVAIDEEAVNCLLVPHVMSEMFRYSGRVVDALYVGKPPTGVTERFAVEEDVVAVVYLYLPSPYILMLLPYCG